MYNTWNVEYNFVAPLNCDTIMILKNLIDFFSCDKLLIIMEVAVHYRIVFISV